MALAHALEQQIPGFKACFGGEELKRASAALGGALDASRAPLQPLPSPHDPAPANPASSPGGLSISSAPASLSASHPPRAAPGVASAASRALSALLARQAAATAEGAEIDLTLRELALAANQYARLEEEAATATATTATTEAAATDAAGPAARAPPSSSSSPSPEAPAGAAGGGGYGGYDDYDVAYHHGLVLQELAGRLAAVGGSWGGPEEQLELLQQACALYAAACAARPAAHAALYNWGVALSDSARLLKEADPQRALACLQQASHRYAEALDLSPGNPQALNNWGLVLQEMCAHAASGPEHEALVRAALQKFRHAIRLRPDFDRGAYNLGTVLYTHAAGAQAELAAQLKDAAASRDPHAAAHREARVRSLFSAAAQYIALAAALQPARDIYRRSLAVVRPMLPLPFLRAGYLTAPTPPTLGTPAEVWRRQWFVLDAASLRTASAAESALASGAAAGGSLGAALGPTLRIGHAVGEGPLEVPLGSIVSVRRCFDPSLPEGEALWLQLAYPLAGGSSSSNSTGAGGGGGGSSSAATGGSVNQHHPWPAAAAAAAAAPALAAGPAAAASNATAAAAAAAAPASTHAPGGGGSGGSSGSGGCCSLCLVADDGDTADAWADALLLCKYVVASRSGAVLAEALAPAAPPGSEGGGGGYYHHHRSSGGGA